MKRMNHGGSLGSQHQLQAGLGSNQVMIIYINNKIICCVPRTKSKKAQQHSYWATFLYFILSANPRFWPKPDGRIWRSGEGDPQKVWTCGLLSCHGQRQVKPLPIPRPCVSILISLSYSIISKCIALLFGFTLPQNHVLRWYDWLPDYWTIIITITIITIIIFIITSSPCCSQVGRPSVLIVAKQSSQP